MIEVNSKANSSNSDVKDTFNDKEFYRDSEQLIDFISKSPSPYHVIDNIKKMLSANNMTELSEKEMWHLEAGHGYYVIRGNSSIIAFTIPQEGASDNPGKTDDKRKYIYNGYNIVASHSDSPSFKLKEKPEIPGDNHYVSLNVEKYGGMIMSTWLDRPLSIAGRAVVADNKGVKEYLINADRDLLVIPNLAIHMNRNINESNELNAQKDMLPLFGDENAKNKFDEYINSLLEPQLEADGWDNNEKTSQYTAATELFLYNRERGTIWGYNNEFISAPRLDDIQCAYSSVRAFVRAYCNKRDTDLEHIHKSNASTAKGVVKDKVNVCCVFNNEEVGSTTRQGADSTFLSDVLERISIASGKTREEYMMALASSYMISADNAHALHPNHQEKADPTNRPYMNSGIVIKFNGNQKYTTDAASQAVFMNICKRADVPYQTYANRSDVAGGSTLGNISNSHVSINTVDIGLAQLAMHSAYETAGVKDTTYMIAALTEFYA